MNWLGLAGAIATFAVVILSLAFASPWWQLKVGQELGQADISPLNFNVSLLGTSISIPIIWFLNLACQLSLMACAIALLVYSVVPEKKYSKSLLGFAYKKPLIIIIFFLASLFIATNFAGMLLRLNIPIAGSTTITLDVGDATLGIPISTGFTWVFWLAVIAGGLCIAARFYHKRIVSAPVAVSQIPVEESKKI